jgi:hypothetical protein
MLFYADADDLHFHAAQVFPLDDGDGTALSFLATLGATSARSMLCSPSSWPMTWPTASSDLRPM